LLNDQQHVCHKTYTNQFSENTLKIDRARLHMKRKQTHKCMASETLPRFYKGFDMYVFRNVKT